MEQMASGCRGPSALPFSPACRTILWRRSRTNAEGTPVRQHGRQDGTVGVSGGRLLSYRGYGPPDGLPVLFFPGTPGSAVEWSMWPSGSAERSGIRVIAVDRPGLGWSDWQPSRRVLDWPVDVTALADALGLQRFTVLGYSGGVPYALACGQLLPDRVSAVTLVGCVGSDDEPGLVARPAPAGRAHAPRLSTPSPASMADLGGRPVRRGPLPGTGADPFDECPAGPRPCCTGRARPGAGLPGGSAYGPAAGSTGSGHGHGVDGLAVGAAPRVDPSAGPDLAGRAGPERATSDGPPVGCGDPGLHGNVLPGRRAPVDHRPARGRRRRARSVDRRLPVGVSGAAMELVVEDAHGLLSRGEMQRAKQWGTLTERWPRRRRCLYVIFAAAPRLRSRFWSTTPGRATVSARCLSSTSLRWLDGPASKNSSATC